MHHSLFLWRPRKPGRAISLKNSSEIQHVLQWKERTVAQSGWDVHPTVSHQCQELKKTSGDFAGTLDPVKLSLLSLLYRHVLVYLQS